MLLITGIALVVSGVSVFYEDVKYLMTVLLQVLYFAVPVMYFVEQVKNSTANHNSHGLLFKLYMLNPLVTILTAFRFCMLQPTYIPPSAHSIGIRASSDVPMSYLLFTTGALSSVAWRRLRPLQPDEVVVCGAAMIRRSGVQAFGRSGVETPGVASSGTPERPNA